MKNSSGLYHEMQVMGSECPGGGVLVALSAGTEGASRLVGFEPLAVLGDEALPLLRDVLLEEDGAYRTDGLAGGAVDAGLGVDVVLLVLRGAVDTVDGADVNAALVLGADARFGDYVRHECIPPR